MSRKHTIEIFKFTELSPAAQSKARDWYRENNNPESYSEAVVAEFIELATACGFDIEKDNVYWQGFHVQGSGASFYGTWHAGNVNVDQLLKDWPDTPGNEQSTRIMREFKVLADADRDAYGGTNAHHREQYQVETDYDTNEGQGEGERPEVLARFDTFKTLCDDLASWLYNRLEQAYECENSDENVGEILEINDYEFLRDGSKFRL